MTARTKRIFISDIHMGDDRSLLHDPPGHPYPYGWLRDNIPKLATFLAEQLRANDVGEVVILGDLFDKWVIPSDKDPLTSCDAICNNPANSAIIANLKTLASSSDIALSYVPGNHDISQSLTDLTTTGNFLKAVFPGIHYISDDNLPTGVYQRGKLAAEHGNRYCLFNAPDTWTLSASFLPLGYFISRMVAYKVSKTGGEQDYLDILKKFIGELKDSSNFIKDVFYAVAQDAGLTENDTLDMKGIDGFPATVTVKSIGTQYDQLVENWEKNHNKINWMTAAIGDVGDLSLAANLTYFSLFGSDKNIVIFGHTHIAAMKKHYILADAEEILDKHLELPCRAIYANSGTWVDSVISSTYVETEEDTDAGRHYVRVMAYPSKTVLKEGFVKL